MKPYPLTGPEGCGVYIVRNRTTGQVYVGQSVDLRRRYAEWRATFSSGLGATNRALHGAIEVSNINDWDFVVFELSKKENLNRLEEEVIEKVRAQIGDRCINGTEPKTTRMPSALQASLKLSQVTDESGVLMTNAQVAARCGVTRQAVKKRLAAWRAKGKYNITIRDLI